MFKLNFKIALRNLWKNKGFTLINLGGLAIGLASCMILLLYVAYEWGYDKQFTNYKNTYVVFNNQKTATTTFTFGATPGVLANEVKTKIAGISNVTRLSYGESKLITYNNNNFKKFGTFADPEFLKIIDYKILKGNQNHLLKNPNSIVISETLAQSLFGNEDPINKIIKLNNNQPLTVEAVIADAPKNSSLQFDYILPWVLFENENPFIKSVGWDSNFCMTLIQMQNNSNFNAADKILRNFFRNQDKTSNNEAFMFPLYKWHLYGKFENGISVGGKIDQLRIFLLLAFSILLIACVNFMNLSTAKSEKRAREVGVRKAIGSSRTSLVKQFLFESFLLSLLSMVLAFVLIEVSLPYFNNLLHITLQINYSDWKFWSTFLGLTIITGFVAGSYPAFYLSSFQPIKVLKGFALTGSSSLSVRKFLVVFQFVFAACLIVCTGFIYRQLNYIRVKPIGYDKNNLIEVPIQGVLNSAEKRKLLKDQLLKSGAVTNVTEYSASLTEGGNNGYGVSWPGKDPNEKVLVNFRWAGYDFVKTTGMTLVRGRDFSSAFADTANVIVNEELIKVMGLKDPVGKQITWGRPITIIGVLKDYVMESAYKKPAPLIMAMNGGMSNMILRLNPNQNLTSSLNTIDGIFKDINPAFPIDRKFVDEKFESKFRDEKLLGTLSNWFGGFAIFISCLGLLGLALYMAEQRKKEISIRKVLGASTGNILALLNKDFIKLVAIANIIAFPLAYIIVNKWLSGYEYRVSISSLPFIAAIGLSVLIAILTVSVQSFKVAKANPIDALKHE
ncbi:ABC transporter permease [Pedobacter nototheniae]|uniref:ABC transporter permease n=1 Tax=Pedobacter nototheniae TaxID=2488994 RepID=UPI00292E20F2|nr:ABC transporter permease [Pedobacter nototheniae]